MIMETLLRRGILSLLLLSTITYPLWSRAQSTTFSYQGRLNDASRSATGSYDLSFTLYDSTNQPGTVVAGPITNSPTAVTNGLFTVTLDFGSGVFSGSDRWVEIAVRTNGSGAFVVLLPRQLLTPAPYAIHAANAGSLENNGLVGLRVQMQPNSGSLSNIINVAGGSPINVSAGNAATVAGGGASVGGFDFPNRVIADYGTIGGGAANTVTSGYGTVAGGWGNDASGVQGSTISGGTFNTASGFFSTVGGGGYNVASGAGSFVGGGGDDGVKIARNTASGTAAVVVGGMDNFATGNASTVGGGNGNAADGNGIGFATVGGGNNNGASGAYTTISGGNGNQAATNYATVGGGASNGSKGEYATVSGGGFNQATGRSAFVGGGGGLDSAGGGPYPNTANGDWSVIGGGSGNVAAGNFGVISGGEQNTASSYATSGGGLLNRANGYSATIGGGYVNQATNSYATVPGGAFNIAGGLYSFAAGQNAQALHQGSFVWTDSQGAPLSSTANNQFLIRAAGGVGINKNNPAALLDVNGTARVQGANGWDVNNGEGDLRVGNDTYRFKIGVAIDGGGAGDVWMRAHGGTGRIFLKTPGGTTIYSNEGQTTGVSLAAGSSAWSSGSDRNTKENFAGVDAQKILQRVASLPLRTLELQDSG